MGKKNVIAEIRLHLTEESDTRHFDVLSQGDLQDFRYMAEKLSQTTEGKAILALLGTMAEYGKQGA